MHRRALTIGVLFVVCAFTLSGCAAVPTDLEAEGVTDHPECGPLPPLEMPDSDLNEVAPPSSVATVADVAVQSDGQLPALIDTAKTLAATPTRADVVLPASGIRIDVVSDGTLNVDADRFEELFAQIFTTGAQGDDPRLAALWACYQRRVFDERELDTTTLRLYVPADPNVCFANYQIAVRDGSCDARGASLPPVNLAPTLFGLELGHLRAPPTILLAPGVPDRELPTLVHELVHHIDTMLGHGPTGDGMGRYEQRAYYLERLLADEIARGDAHLDLPWDRSSVS